MTYIGNVGLCLFFQMNAITPAMTPETTNRTVATMAPIAPAETEQAQLLFRVQAQFSGDRFNLRMQQ